MKKPITLLAIITAIIIGLSATEQITQADTECIPQHTPVVWNEVPFDEEVAPFGLTDYERYVAECIVMGEAAGESYEGKMLVAQCLLNACYKDDLKPSEVRIKYQYSGWNENPSEEVKSAVSAVFDERQTVTDEPILYFYAPKWCVSEWHETQEYVLTEGGHRFFKEV